MTGLLNCTNPGSLWHIAYALRTRRREFVEKSRAVQEVDLILKDLEETMHSELRSSKEQGVTYTKEHKLWLYYSIIMLSHGAPATLSNTAIYEVSERLKRIEEQQHAMVQLAARAEQRAEEQRAAIESMGKVLRTLLVVYGSRRGQGSLLKERMLRGYTARVKIPQRLYR